MKPEDVLFLSIGLVIGAIITLSVAYSIIKQIEFRAYRIIKILLASPKCLSCNREFESYESVEAVHDAETNTSSLMLTFRCPHCGSDEARIYTVKKGDSRDSEEGGAE